jgi:hypothetical protein
MPSAGNQWAIEMITEAGSPSTPNEDAYCVWQSDEMLFAAVFDGVTQLLTFPSLAELVGPALTPGRFAATLARDTFMRGIVDDPSVPLRALFHAANDAIAHAVSQIYDACSAEAVVKREPDLKSLLGDPRSVRLILPATVATVARVDRRAGTIEWMHLGDTALITLADPSLLLTYAPRLGIFGEDATYQALCQTPVAPQLIRPSLAAVSAETMRVEVAGRFYHNYVAPDGHPDPSVGVGVMDGLPAMDAYLRQGQISLERCYGILLCSDGFFFPPDALTHWGDMSQHSHYIDAMMRELISCSMIDYVAALRQAVARLQSRICLSLRDPGR